MSFAPIRSMKNGDEEGLAFVHATSWHETYTGLIPDSFLKNVTPAGRLSQWTNTFAELQANPKERAVFVAEKDGKIVGFSSLGKSRGKIDGYSAEIFAIYLLRAEQGQGVGYELLKASQDWAKAQGHDGIGLWVLEGNPTQRFYQRAGFQILGISEVVEFSGEKRNHLAMGMRF